MIVVVLVIWQPVATHCLGCIVTDWVAHMIEDPSVCFLAIPSPLLLKFSCICQHCSPIIGCITDIGFLSFVHSCCERKALQLMACVLLFNDCKG